VHGGFVGGSGWEDVYQILKKDGYRVSVVQNPTASLADDAAVTRRVIAEQKGPVLLVGGAPAADHIPTGFEMYPRRAHFLSKSLASCLSAIC